MAHAYKAVLIQKQGRIQFWNVESKSTKCVHHLTCILFRLLDPKIQISSGSGISVVAYCIAADHEIPHIMIVQQPQEFAEFGRKLDRRHN